MIKKIEYTTVQQQVLSLKEKGLLFNDEEKAKFNLARYGYYNIINSYKEPYQLKLDGKKEYIEGTTFEQIYSVFTLDHNLRNSIMAAMLELEECLRAATAEVIAFSFGVNHKEYLQYKNYRDRVATSQRFTLRGVLDTLEKNIASGKDPIRYYREKYDIVPPWILLKGTYFSTLVNLIKCLKKEQKQYLMRLLLRIPKEQEITEEITTLFQTILFICLDYRNAAAHGGRIYNFRAPHVKDIRLTDETLKMFPELRQVDEAFGIRQLLILLTIFRVRNSFRIIHDSLDKQLNRHLNEYPQDESILSGSIGIPIKRMEYVWVNERNRKYHHNKFCGGMVAAKRMDINEMDKEIYTPCKRCI